MVWLFLADTTTRKLKSPTSHGLFFYALSSVTKLSQFMETIMARAPATPSLKDTSWLDKLSLEELLRLADDIQNGIRAKREEAKEAARAEITDIVEKARLLGLDPAEIIGRPRKVRGNRSEVKPKYRDKRDPTQTWSGRGRIPRWLKERIDGGEDKDDYLIR
jgi:DNA-binding protein H-NS